MKDAIVLAIKGFIIGVANIIPGVSGGTLAITLGIYEKLINTISHFFHNLKENIKFIIPIGIGGVLSIVLLSKLIKLSLDKYPLPTTLFFMGLILGGIPLLWRKVKGHKKKIPNIIIGLLTFGLVTIFAFLKTNTQEVNMEDLTVIGYVLLFIVGIISAATMVIPGISGSFILMLLGYYKPIINTVSDITNFSHLKENLLILIPFGIGVVLGIILVAKLIEFLLKKFEIPTYFGIIGFILASILSMILPLTNVTFTVMQVVCGTLLAGIGFMIAYRLGGE